MLTTQALTVRAPMHVGRLALRNRIYRAPVLEGAGSAIDPAGEYIRHFVPNAETGTGLIIQGNTIVLPEGRTSPGMSAIAERSSMLALARVPEAVHAAGGRIVIQLGHGGIFALESWHRAFKRDRAQPPLAPSTPPWWLRPTHGRVHVLSTAEVKALVARFGEVARWAQEAGYDGVQLAASNAKLLHQFLSPVYNRRKDRYGGSPAGRATLLFEIREQIAKTCGAGFPVLLKFCAQELGARGRHLTLEQGIGLAQGAQEAGFDALTPVAASVLPDTALCRGQFPKKSFGNSALQAKLREATGSRLRSGALKLNMRIAAWRFPYRPVWNRPVFGAVKRAVSIPVFAVGGIRTPAEANQILTSGEADLIGVGRPFYAEPALAARWLAAADDCHEPTACANCNQCVVPQMLGLPGACYSPTTQKRARALESRDD